MIDASLLEQLRAYFTKLQHPVVFKANLDDSQAAKEMDTFLSEVAPLSSLLSYEKVDDADVRKPSFQITRGDADTGIRFAGTPMGHEFTSFVLAVLQAGGYPSKATPEQLEQIRQLSGPLNFEVYFSLTCHNCPDVVQALNLMATVNPEVRVTNIDGSIYQDEVNERKVMAVPTVYLNGELFFSGRNELADILTKLDTDGSATKKLAEKLSAKETFDVLVVGAGPAGCTAAIYSARKGLRTGLIAERVGGQVNETADIQNFTSIISTSGEGLAKNFGLHVQSYDVDMINNQRVEKIERSGNLWLVTLTSGATLTTKSLIAATGARWKTLNVPGEEEYKGHGVAYCPHCDGPLFKGMRVAVTGGGNSGVEAAIDLAGICEHVTLLQSPAQLKADEVLQEKGRSLKNITILLNARTTELTGSNGKLEHLTYRDTTNDTLHTIDVAGCFVQIGLTPNTDWIKDVVETNKFGEIVKDDHGATSAEGIFAAGDCTNTPYKQVVIGLGEGATAALGAFDYLIRRKED